VDQLIALILAQHARASRWSCRTCGLINRSSRMFFRNGMPKMPQLTFSLVNAATPNVCPSCIARQETTWRSEKMGEEMLLVNVVTDLSLLLRLDLYAPFLLLPRTKSAG
jgi:hypothetical protein